jgi:hypothetical protein
MPTTGAASPDARVVGGQVESQVTAHRYSGHSQPGGADPWVAGQVLGQGAGFRGTGLAGPWASQVTDPVVQPFAVQQRVWRHPKAAGRRQAIAKRDTVLLAAGHPVGEKDRRAAPNALGTDSEDRDSGHLRRFQDELRDYLLLDPGSVKAGRNTPIVAQRH